MQKISVDIAIVGAGTAGLYALSEARRQGLRWVLIEGGEGGTTCARVGCMPSKVLLHAAQIYQQTALLDQMGFSLPDTMAFDSARFMNYLREMRDQFVKGVTSRTMDRMQPPELLRGYARFCAPNQLQVGDKWQVDAKQIVLATGSSPVVPAAWRALGDAIVTTDQLFELDRLPSSMAIVGLGPVGLEISQALHRLGVDVEAYDAGSTLSVFDNPEMKESLFNHLNREYPIHLGQQVRLEADDMGLRLTAGDRTRVFEKALIAIGRQPNIGSLNLSEAGVDLDERGLPHWDPQSMRIQGSEIYLAGDVTSERAVMHEAGLEALMALRALSTGIATQRRKTAMGIVFTSPNIARVGTRSSPEDSRPRLSVIHPVAANARARVNHATEGAICLEADATSGQLLSAELFCDSAEHLAHQLAWMIEMKADIRQLAKMPVYHPVMEEALMGAIEALALKFSQQRSLAELKL